MIIPISVLLYIVIVVMNEERNNNNTWASKSIGWSRQQVMNWTVYAERLLHSVVSLWCEEEQRAQIVYVHFIVAPCTKSTSCAYLAYLAKPAHTWLVDVLCHCEEAAPAAVHSARLLVAWPVVAAWTWKTWSSVELYYTLLYCAVMLLVRLFASTVQHKQREVMGDGTVDSG